MGSEVTEWSPFASQGPMVLVTCILSSKQLLWGHMLWLLLQRIALAVVLIPDSQYTRAEAGRQMFQWFRLGPRQTLWRDEQRSYFRHTLLLG